MSIIPSWTFPPKEATGQAPSAVTNQAASGSAPGDLSVYALGRDQIIPIVYGGPERMAGLVYIVATPKTGSLAGKLVIASVLCEGPVEEVSGFQVNNDAVPAHIQLHAYTGAPGQPVDAWLASAVPGFNESLPGIAYFVALVSPADNSFPQITALVKGLKVFDERENRFTYSNKFNTASAWTDNNLSALIQGATAPDGTPTAWTMTDNNAATFGGCGRGSAVPNDSAAYSFSIRVKKTTGGVSPTFGINVNLTGGAPAVSNNLRLNTDTGARVGGGIFWTIATDERDSTFWKCTGTITNNASGNVTLSFKIYPATGAHGSGLDVAATTGSAIVCWAGMAFGPVSAPYTETEGAAIVPGIKWSDNPARCLADFMANRAGLPVDASYTASAAGWCDQLLTGPGGSEKRSRFTLALAEKRTCSQWIETMRAYVPAWVVDAGDAWRIVADMPRATDHFFGPTTIAADSPPQITRGGTRDVPNFVEVSYTETANVPWQSLTASAEIAGAPEVRRNRVDMPGIRSYSQARRFALERLNHYTLEDVTGAMSVFDEGLKVLPGDVCAISEDAFGWAGKLVRVLDAVEKDTGRWDIQFREYDPAAYASEVATTPTSPDTSLSSPLTVAPPSGLVLAEVLAPESNLAADGVGTSIIYQSRIKVTWAESSDPYLSHYDVAVYLGSLLVFTGQVLRGVGIYVTSTVQQLASYNVQVLAVNSLGIRSDAAIADIFIDGKQIPPTDVPAITQAIEIGGEVLLTWEPAIDFDALRYEWRVDLGNVGTAWDSMMLVDAIDGLRARFRGIAPGTHRFCVKAIDSVGHYSANGRCVVLTVTSDSSAYLTDQKFTSPTLVRMVRLNTPFDETESDTLRPRWVVSDAATRSWDASMPSPIDSGTLPVFSYGAGTAGKASWRGESCDLGFTLTGDFSIAVRLTVYTGAVKKFLEVSSDGSTWTQIDLTTAPAWKGSARFIRPYFESVAAGASWLIEGPPQIKISAVERTESGGPITSSATLPTRITLANRYAKATLINVQPTNTTGARTSTIDNVIVGTGVANSFDVYLFDSSGVQRADQFYWTFKGV